MSHLAQMATVDANAATNSIGKLEQTINAIESAPIEIADLKSGLLATEQVLRGLLDANRDSQLEILPFNPIEALRRTNILCKSACDRFKDEIESWTKRSDSGVSMGWRDRDGFDMLTRRSIKSLCEQLERCRSNVELAVAIATMYVFANA